jgi:sterol 3beta-glucosyltransferase
MRVVVFAYGSRGDVQPFVAVADRLRRRGHEPVLAGPAAYGWLAEERGIEFVPLDDRLNDVFLTDPDVVGVQTIRNPPLSMYVRAYRTLRRVLDARLPVVLDQMLAAAKGADLVVQGYDEIPVEQGHHVAEGLGIPWLLVTLSPNFVPSRHYPCKLVPAGRTYPPLVTRASHLLRIGFRSLGTVTVHKWRPATLGLPNRWRQNNRMRYPDGRPVPLVQLFSPELVPPAPDWPDWVHSTGFCFLEGTEEGAPPAGLAEFLAAGEPPVCVGFGSVRGLNPHAAGRAVVAGVRKAGVRAVVVRAGGSIEIDDPPQDVLVVDEVPYSWLFPRVRAVVHGASVGISSEALRVGLPQVACPPTGEALAWAAVLSDAGVAPPPLMLRDLTADTLAAALEQALTDPAVRARATELAGTVRDGADEAARTIEELARTLGVTA